MTKAQLESKTLAELHALAADADVPRYRMLPRAELIEKLADGPKPQGDRPRGRGREGGGQGREGGGQGREGGRGRQGAGGSRQGGGRGRERRPVQRGGRERQAPADRGGEPRVADTGRSDQPPAGGRTAEPRGGAVESQPEGPSRPRRRRRRWRRRGRKVRIADLLLPAAPGRQAILHSPTREACTAALREMAGELSSASKGPDPIALLVDPSPEELADWRRRGAAGRDRRGRPGPPRR